MARPKEFDRDHALQQAMQVFWKQGFNGASTDDLVAAMGIGRQSLYDSFGDKKKLYFEALRLYHANAGFPEALRSGGRPLEVIRRALLTLAQREPERRAMGCMGINATTAFGDTEPAITAMSALTATLCEAGFEQAISQAKRLGEIAASVDERAAAMFLYTTLQGLTVRAQAGAAPETLEAVVDFTLATLQPRSGSGEKTQPATSHLGLTG